MGGGARTWGSILHLQGSLPAAEPLTGGLTTDIRFLTVLEAGRRRPRPVGRPLPATVCVLPWRGQQVLTSPLSTSPTESGPAIETPFNLCDLPTAAPLNTITPEVRALPDGCGGHSPVRSRGRGPSPEIALCRARGVGETAMANVLLRVGLGCRGPLHRPPESVPSCVTLHSFARGPGQPQRQRAGPCPTTM